MQNLSWVWTALMCPVCYKVGQAPTKRKPVKKKFSNLTGKEKAEAFKQEEKRKEQAKRDEINALWATLTPELWQKDRRKYMETMKKIKRKESIIFA